MLTNDITPAERKLIEFIRQTDADALHRYLSTTLSLSMGNFFHPDEDSGPTKPTVDAWYFTNELNQKLHTLSVEGKIN